MASSLLTGLSGQAWRGAVERLGAPFLRLVIIGEGAVESYCHWPEVSETEEAGAVLVRPDGYGVAPPRRRVAGGRPRRCCARPSPASSARRRAGASAADPATVQAAS